MNQDNESTVEVGQNNTIVIRHKGTSTPIIAKSLGIEYRYGNPVKIYLDRIVDGGKLNQIGPWDVTGAISSILTLQEASA